MKFFLDLTRPVLYNNWNHAELLFVFNRNFPSILPNLETISTELCGNFSV
jgi:hypothetical protein